MSGAVSELQAAVARRDAGAGRAGPGWRRASLALLWAATAAFAVLRFLGEPGSVEAFGNWFQILTIPFFAAAGAGALVGAAARAGRAALGWRAVAGAWFVSALGYLAALLAPEGQPAWLDACGTWLYDAYYPFMVGGLLLMAAAPTGLARRWRALLDVALVLGATTLLSWWLVLRSADPGRLGGNLTDVAVLLLGELAVLGSAAWLLATAGGRPDPALRLLGAASVVATLADLATARFSIGGAPAASRFADAGVVLGAALVASAGLARPGDARRRRLGADLVGGTLGHVPTLAVLATMALLVVEAWQVGGTWPVVALGTAAITVVALLALALARHDLEDEAAARTGQAERLAGAQRLATVGHLAGAVAHDFNNLAVAMGEIASELREAPAGPATADDLEALSKRAAALCRRLLGMARGAGEARPAPHELGAAVAGLEPLLRRLLPPRIRVEAEATAPAWAVVDLAQLELAIVNLVVNARDAIQGAGTVTLSAHRLEVAAGDALSARGVAPGPHVVLSVTDDGAGMDAATLAHVAEPFFTTKPPGQGTGLGLSLVADMAAAAGGRVVIDSAPGRGTTVRLVLPARAG